MLNPENNIEVGDVDEEDELYEKMYSAFAGITTEFADFSTVNFQFFLETSNIAIIRVNGTWKLN